MRSDRIQSGAGRVRVVAAAILAAILALAPAAAMANPCANGGNPVPLRYGPGAEEGGVGGTGIDNIAPHADEREGGVGGTGIAVGGDEEGGVGGTGIDAAEETAVLGIVTGFASICVGGVEVQYDASTAVRRDGAAAAVDTIAIGEVVHVVAAGSGDSVRAMTIDVDHIVAGPITAIDSDDGRIDVMNQRVQLAEPEGEGIGELAVGQWVDVSGLRRRDGTVVASRLDVREGDLARVTGAVELSDGPRGRIGGVPVRFEDATPDLSTSTWTAVGRWIDGELRVDLVEPDRATTLRRSGRRARIEGYIGATPAHGIEVGGWSVDIPDSARSSWTNIGDERPVRLRAVIDPRGHLVPEGMAIPEPGGRPDRPPRWDVDSGAAGGDAGGDAGGPPAEMRAQPRPGNGRRPPGGAYRSGAGRPPRPERPRRPDIPRAQRPEPPRRPPGPPPGPRPPR